MTVQEKMAWLQAVKVDIKQALIDKGVDMTDVPFTEYAEKINVMSGLTPSVISTVKNCRLLLPYTSDTIDNSLYSVPLNTNGAVLGSNGATFADGKYVGISDAINDYLTSYNTTQPYTFEVILTLSNTSKYSYIINALTNGGSYLIVHDNKLVYRNAGNTTELISVPYTYTTKKHIALVYDGTTIKLYLDGVEKGSTTTKNTAKSDGYCLLGYSTSGYSISGTCGGVRLTSKALSPAEFSDRPMTLWSEVNPTDGNRTYLYNDGDQCISLTGGWEFTNPSSPASNFTHSLNKNGCLYWGGQNTGDAYFKTKNVINMENYDRLIVEFYHESTANESNAQFGIIGSGVSAISKMYLAPGLVDKITFLGTAALFNGLVTLWTYTGAYSTIHVFVKRVWLERG